MKLVSIRFSDEQWAMLEEYRAENNIENRSECIRQVLMSSIQKETDDKNLTLQSLSTMHDRLTKSLENEEILLNLMMKMYQNLLVYQAEIPEEMKASAVRDAVRRFKKLMEAFKKGLKENPERFESLLADNIEER
jgi:metal-responsive CopG/Arc/MetJ family transcriptional regulator